MAKKDIKKCNYSHCKHLSNSINIKFDEYVTEKSGGLVRYYHPDCKHEKDAIQEIIDYWYVAIDPNVIFGQLRRIIDKIIYEMHIDADFVLYALRKKSQYLHHPPGLMYAIQDKNLKKQFEYDKKKDEFNNSKKEPVIIKQEEPTFTYNVKGGNRKFSDIFGGK